jgi:hypothetical protein
MLIISGDLRSLKDGRTRRVLPEWVDDYIPKSSVKFGGQLEPTTRRHNREGSIFPYRNGFCGLRVDCDADGWRQRKYAYGKSRQAVHDQVQSLGWPPHILRQAARRPRPGRHGLKRRYLTNVRPRSGGLAPSGLNAQGTPEICPVLPERHSAPAGAHI